MRRYKHTDNKDIEILINSPSYTIFRNEVYLENSTKFKDKQRIVMNLNKLKRKKKREYTLIDEINSEGISKNGGNTTITINKVKNATGYKIYKMGS